MFWYFLILTLFSRKVTINIVNSNSTPCLKTPVLRHYTSGNGRTVKGSTVKGSTAKASTVKGSTAKASTVKGSTAIASTVKGSTIKASTAIASTVKGSTIKASTVKGKSPPRLYDSYSRRSHVHILAETSLASNLELTF